MELKVIFIDLDGTLVNGKLKDRNYISPENIEACKAAQLKGIYTVINTGRGFNVCRQLQKKININSFGNYYIAFNGAYIGNLSHNEIIYSKLIDPKNTNLIIEIAKKYRFSIKFDEPFEFYGTNLLTRIYVKFLKVPVKLHNKYHLERIKNKNYYKILLTGRKKSVVQKIIKDLRKLLPDLAITTSGNGWVVEITAKNTSKGTAAKFLCKKLKIDLKKTAAIGDSMNDQSIFEVVGRSIAVENANTDLKKIASEITTHHKKDAVANWILKNI